MQGATYCHDCKAQSITDGDDVDKSFLAQHNGHRVTAWFIESEGGRAYARRRGVPDEFIEFNPADIPGQGKPQT